MPPHESTTLTLAGLALEGRERVLDLGCGSGIIALRLAATGHRATGTDINPRALLFSRWNAAANRVAATFHAAAEVSTAAPFDHLVFNSPTGPAFASEDDDQPEIPMSAVDAVTVAAGTARRYLRPDPAAPASLSLLVSRSDRAEGILTSLSASGVKEGGRHDSRPVRVGRRRRAAALRCCTSPRGRSWIF